MLKIQGSPLSTHNSPFTTHNSPFTIHYFTTGKAEILNLAAPIGIKFIVCSAV